MPERISESNRIEQALEMIDGGRRPGRVESVAVPTQGEFPHDRKRSGHPAVDPFLRPEEADVRSCLDDVIPPVPGRDREVDESIARLAGRTSVLDPEVDESVVVEPASLNLGVDMEGSRDRQGVPCAVGPPTS